VYANTESAYACVRWQHREMDVCVCICVCLLFLFLCKIIATSARGYTSMKEREQRVRESTRERAPRINGVCLRAPLVF
jgi:hypothetical protein